MIKKSAFLLLVVFIPCFTSFCVGQGSENDRRNEEIIRQVYDSLELRQMPAREVKYSCKGLYEIKVSNQQQFDKMPSNLMKALNDGKRNIKVEIKKGTYFFSNSYLTLKGFDFPDADIRMEGKNVVIVPAGYFLKNGDSIPCDVSGESCYLDLDGVTSLSTWGEMMFADELIEVIDLASKTCRLKCDAIKSITLPEGNQAYLDLTRWCRCYQYKVLKIDNGYIYFYAHDLEKDNVYHKDEYNVNYDYICAKTYPRFRLCNADKEGKVSVLGERLYLGNGLSEVHLGDAATFMMVRDTKLHNISLSGITFLGSKPSPMSLFYFRDVKTANIEFHDCKFIGQRNKIMNLYASDNLYFHDNYVRDNYDYGIETDNLTSNTYVVNNCFEENGTSLSCTRCVTCRGRDYYIAHNTFKNFGYCAISAGLWYGTEMENPSGGIIEYNHIWYDKEHFDNAWKYTIMDAGAIYLWTQNKDAVVRYNYIHDYTGLRQNRGIYCDDGAKGVSIYGNVIINVPNIHSIDSRRVAGTEMASNKVSKSERNNINNVMMYNLTDGTINFVGNEMAHNGCKKGRNMLLREKGVVREPHEYKPQLKNLEVDIKDEDITFLGHDEKGVIVTRDIMEEIKKMPCYDGMKRYLRVVPKKK